MSAILINFNRTRYFNYRYFLKFEKFVPHKLFPKVDVSLRGASGPVEGEFHFMAFCRMS